MHHRIGYADRSGFSTGITVFAENSQNVGTEALAETGQGAGIEAFAAGGKNAYNHEITYKPLNRLYTDNQQVKFFDYDRTAWDALSDTIKRNEAASIKWLRGNKYLLNHFGRHDGGSFTGKFSSDGNWQTQVKGPTNVWSWKGWVSFDALTDAEKRANGNISSMYDKGDLQYFFSWKVKSIQTSWGLFGKSNDTGYTSVLGITKNSKGGQWHKYFVLGNGPDLFDPNGWKSADKLSSLYFRAASDKDAQVDSYLSGAMLVGRDVKGPKIDSVRMTLDREGRYEVENGVVRLDT
jgi:hypothetical protein